MLFSSVLFGFGLWQELLRYLLLAAHINYCVKGTPENAVDFRVNQAVQMASHPAVDTDKTGLMGDRSAFVDGKTGLADNGIAQQQNLQERIFERFYRVDKSRTKDIQDKRTTGTGLGLSIVKHGAKYHNAKISVKSKIGEGSEFSLMFPI